jgi:hypothetical protein
MCGRGMSVPSASAAGSRFQRGEVQTARATVMQKNVCASVA